MKKKLIIIILCFLTQNILSQNSEIINDTSIQSLTEIDTPPKFPGGPAELYKYINESIDASNNENKTKVFIRFVVEIDGSLSNIEFIRKKPDAEISTKIVKVFQMCPKWIPGEFNGRKVRVLYSLPINY